MMPFLVALLAGLLIGIERERSKGQGDIIPILGARTFPLLALTGALIAFLNNEILIIFISLFLSILILPTPSRMAYATLQPSLMESINQDQRVTLKLLQT